MFIHFLYDLTDWQFVMLTETFQTSSVKKTPLEISSSSKLLCSQSFSFCQPARTLNVHSQFINTLKSQWLKLVFLILPLRFFKYAVL